MSGGLDAARRALDGERTWLVGGAVRDRLLAGAVAPEREDVDLVVDGDAEAAARALARETRAFAFPLSERFGQWRVVPRDGGWQADIAPLAGGSIEADLAGRDFTVNAIAEPLGGGDPIDPTGGIADLEQRRLRMVTPEAFAADPVRVLRLPRLACALALEPESETVDAARRQAGGLSQAAGERIFSELRLILAGDEAVRGLRLAESVGATAAVLPELLELRGVEQSAYHHLDVYEHTLAVLAEVIALQRAPETVFPDQAAELSALLAEPFADELTRREAMRFGALLHDVAKPATARQTPEGRVTFLGHDREGARMSREILERLRASERLRTYVAGLALNHLRLGFLVHEAPLSPRAVYRYLKACQPVEVDVTLLSAADRLATRGRRADEAIAAHLDLARDLMPEALRWRAEGQPALPIRGDELAAELGIDRGPRLGELLDELAEARFAGEIATREEAIDLARRLG